MPGYKSKKAMSDSRFAVLYEDPDYEIPELEEEFEDPTEFVSEFERFNPFNTSNS